MTARTDRHERWLTELTRLPSVAGHEDLVIDWVRTWVGRRSDLRILTDEAGNLLITRKGRRRRPPTLLTAHLDHPGFVATSVEGRAVEWQFLGGVSAEYFEGATIEFFDPAGEPHRAKVLSSFVEGRLRSGTARLAKASPSMRTGVIGRWAFRSGSLGMRNGRLYAPGCDDLAGVAAVLAALDDLRKKPMAAHVGVLLTRAEEVGFIGAIAACTNGVIPREARLICVEMSRSFADSPIGDGPIVRVGDASSIFSPEITNRLSRIAGSAAARDSGFRFQRKLMPGGSCEATAFAGYGYSASCLCLPLGNYHNMVDIDGVAAGSRPARVGPEFISVADFHGLVKLIGLAAVELDSTGASLSADFVGHFDQWSWVLG